MGNAVGKLIDEFLCFLRMEKRIEIFEKVMKLNQEKINGNQA